MEVPVRQLFIGGKWMPPAKGGRFQVHYEHHVPWPMRDAP